MELREIVPSSFALTPQKTMPAATLTLDALEEQGWFMSEEGITSVKEQAGKDSMTLDEFIAVAIDVSCSLIHFLNTHFYNPSPIDGLARTSRQRIPKRRLNQTLTTTSEGGSASASNPKYRCTLHSACRKASAATCGLHRWKQEEMDWC